MNFCFDPAPASSTATSSASETFPFVPAESAGPKKKKVGESTLLRYSLFSLIKLLYRGGKKEMEDIHKILTCMPVLGPQDCHLWWDALGPKSCLRVAGSDANIAHLAWSVVKEEGSCSLATPGGPQFPLLGTPYSNRMHRACYVLS